MGKADACPEPCVMCQILSIAWSGSGISVVFHPGSVFLAHERQPVDIMAHELRLIRPTILEQELENHIWLAL
jgi:hypothetical protein